MIQVARLIPAPANEDKVRAYCTLIVASSFYIRNVKLIETRSGFIVAMPSKRNKDGVFKDLAHPVNEYIRKLVNDAVIEAYKKEVGRRA